MLQVVFSQSSQKWFAIILLDKIFIFLYYPLNIWRPIKEVITANKKHMENYLTPDGLKKLKKELDYLKRVKRKEISEKLNHSISFGDLSENAAYDEAKEAQGFLEGKIAELNDVISHAKIISKKQTKNITIGSTVLVSLDHEKEKYEIVMNLKINNIDKTINGKYYYKSKN